MKRLLAVVFTLIFTVLAPAANALPAFGVVVLTGTSFYLGHNSERIRKGIPVSYHLTDACQEKTLKTEGSNISYISYEHCLNK